MKRLVFLMASLSLPVAAAQTTTAPFGIPMGTTVAQLKKMGATPGESKGVYLLRNVPVPNSTFENYMVVAGDRSGVCKIIGIGKDVISSGDGYALRNAFNALNNVLNTKYGTASDKFDFLKSGSIWDETNDFMMGLAQEDRYLDYYWQADKGVKIGNNVSIISLNARALTSTKGYISLGYQYKNFSQCANERSAADASGL